MCTKIQVERTKSNRDRAWSQNCVRECKSKSLKGLLVNKPVGEEEIRVDFHVQSFILNALSPEVGLKVINCNSSHEIWNRLLAIYENSSQANVDRILEEFYSYRMDPKSDIASHISNIESLAVTLEQFKQPQSENAIKTKILMSLPESFIGFGRAWDSVHPEIELKNNSSRETVGWNSPTGPLRGRGGIGPHTRALKTRHCCAATARTVKRTDRLLRCTLTHRAKLCVCALREERTCLRVLCALRVA